MIKNNYFSMRKVLLLYYFYGLICAEKNICSNAFRNETFECSDASHNNNGKPLMYTDLFNVSPTIVDLERVHGRPPARTRTVSSCGVLLVMSSKAKCHHKDALKINFR